MLRLIRVAIVSSLSLAFLSSCGSNEADLVQASKTQSLVALPCQEFGGNFWASNFHCVSFKAGISKEMLFDIQGFDAAQTQKIKDSLDVAVARFNEYFVDPQPLVQCTMSNSDRDYDPQGLIGVSFVGVEKKVKWALTSIQFNYVFHFDLHRPAVIKAFSESSDGMSYTMGRASLGDDSIKQASKTSFENGNMNIELNTAALDANFTADDFAGTIIHEWLHRNGWSHPTGYQGSMIKELGLCVSRNNAPKAFGLSDMAYQMHD